MSAGLVVDLGNTTQQIDSLVLGQGTDVSGSMFAGKSGTVVGNICDMLHANTFTNLYIGGTGLTPLSGPLIVQVQCSDDTVSGHFTDPTSGLAQLPTVFSSGGIVYLNSGGGIVNSGGLFGTFTSGQAIASGFHVTAGFQRPTRYCRAIFMSGAAGSGNQYVGPLQAGFIGQFKTTGSGGGFDFSPTSGSVNV